MRQKFVVVNQSGAPIEVKVRRVKWAGPSEKFPLCAWCRVQELRLMVEVVQTGFTIDLVQAVCYCDSCNLGTVVEFEAEIDVQEDVNSTEYNRA